ncbi:hypothetical protein BU23DRAFT_555825 [Bimuria novae-zelandiae CBS 107.79]|uniref:Uncharacterized protein n=1 Tax=Bimuria novae-zelandiae CBS 107.79 TaxID=1447943 RepID=A0A6A5V4U1_9PLEO|nr:hypothetical protein BU23DRAFT_555825 [Bimuria novae-zelandiae CBS 107.79]
MAGVRPRRHNDSLGDSWGSAEYSDDNVSLDSANSLSDTGSQSDYFEEHGRDDLEDDNEDDMATPMPLPRITRGSQIHQDTPTKISTSRLHSRPQMPRNGLSQLPTPQHSPGPAFIMPSLNASVDGFSNASPLRSSQLKSRKNRQTSSNSQTARQMSRFPSAGNRHAAPHQQQEEAASPWHFVSLFWDNVLRPVLGYILDVFKIGMTSMKPLAGIVVPIGVTIMALQFGSVFLKNTFEATMAPICAIPGSSYILPLCATIPSDRQADFEELANIQSSFEDILASNRDSYALPANMKKSQVAMRDLRIQVRFSNLPSKAELENEFDAFIETAREASDDLAKYNARIGYVTDQLISTNKWTLTVLNGISSSEATKSSLSDALAHMNVFSVFSGPPETLQQRIFAQYVNHVAKTKDDIAGLITFSESLIMLLNNLDARLDIIAEIAMRDDNRVMRDRDELLAHLWSKLGGNRSSKAANRASLQLLRDVLRYRANAVQLVSATLLKLREISQGLENVRDGIAAPEVVGYREDYPLQWHIDVVSRSVERLRDARGEAMAIEREVMHKGMSDGKEGDGARQLPPGEMPTVYARPKEL